MSSPITNVAEPELHLLPTPWRGVWDRADDLILNKMRYTADELRQSARG